MGRQPLSQSAAQSSLRRWVFMLLLIWLVISACARAVCSPVNAQGLLHSFKLATSDVNFHPMFDSCDVIALCLPDGVPAAPHSAGANQTRK